LIGQPTISNRIRSTPEIADSVFWDALGHISSAKDKDEVLKALARTHSELAKKPSPVAAREIRDFLESGNDIATGLGFRVGPNGSLIEQPSLRVAALDWLGEFSSSDAAAYAETIFQSSDSADEWAVALRNFGRSQNARENPSFTDAVHELFVRDQWKANPSEGYFEAFDAVVFSACGEFVRELVDLASESPALVDKAFDGATPNNPKATLVGIPPIVVASDQPLHVRIVYSDSDAIRLSSLDLQDIHIIGEQATLAGPVAVTTDQTSDSSIVIATYQFKAPHGGWTHAWNGTYKVAVMENEVLNTRGFCVRARSLGRFEVNIRAVTGQWDFNDSNLNATVGLPLEFRGDTAAKTVFITMDIKGKPV
jgi:hypothetical protein